MRSIAVRSSIGSHHGSHLDAVSESSPSTSNAGVSQNKRSAVSNEDQLNTSGLGIPKKHA